MKISLLFFIVGMNSTSFSQNRLGIQVTPGWSQSFVPKSDSNSFAFGGPILGAFSISAGIVGERIINENWFFQTGVHYYLTGDRSSVMLADTSRSIPDRYYTARIQSLEIPVNFSRKLVKNIYILAGCSFIVNINSYQRRTFGMTSTSSGYTSRIDKNKYDLKRIGLLGNFGILYRLLLKKRIFSIQPTFQYNFVAPVINLKTIDYLPGRTYASFGLRISYLF